MKSRVAQFIRGSGTQNEKCLVALFVLGKPSTTIEVRAKLVELGLRSAKQWNVSLALSRKPQYCVLVDGCWHIQEGGHALLSTYGFLSEAPEIVNVRNDLAEILERLPVGETKDYISEALDCFRYGLTNSAVVMSWLGAVHVLKLYVQINHLQKFNNEATRVFGRKWKTAKNTDDLGRMKERDLLDRMEAISVIGKNRKNKLIGCLDLRNSCGHPNSLKVGPNEVAAHIETLLLNVFKVYMLQA